MKRQDPRRRDLIHIPCHVPTILQNLPRGFSIHTPHSSYLARRGGLAGLNLFQAALAVFLKVSKVPEQRVPFLERS